MSQEHHATTAPTPPLVNVPCVHHNQKHYNTTTMINNGLQTLISPPLPLVNNMRTTPQQRKTHFLPFVQALYFYVSILLTIYKPC